MRSCVCVQSVLCDGLQVASKHCKKLSLELGGKNANIVFNDADLDVAVATSVRSSFLNQVHTRSLLR